MSSADFFFQKDVSGILSDCKTEWIQIKLDVLLGLIWAQNVCKGCQQLNIGVYSLVVSFDSEVFDIQRVQDSCVLDFVIFFSDITECWI